MRVRVAVALLALLAGGCRGERSGRPNLLVILTDDQRADTMDAMPATRAAIFHRGAVFTNAFSSNPMCCPFRASLLAGGLPAEETGVLTVSPPNGSAYRFDDRSTLATTLRTAGYYTGLVGKYLNGYERLQRRVPPGWDYFRAWTRSGKWRRHRWVEGSVRRPLGREVGSTLYLPEVEADLATQFLQGAPRDRPFFLLFATHVPHRPAEPLSADLEALAGSRASPVEPPALEEELATKPEHVRALADTTDPEWQAFPVQQLATLSHLDRVVARLLGVLQAEGRLDDTVVVFTSDNGFLWGEHGLFQKGLPYTPSARVPLAIRGRHAVPGTRDGLVAVELDLAATLLELAGARMKSRGQSLVASLRDPSADLRPELAVAYYRGASGAGGVLRAADPEDEAGEDELPSRRGGRGEVPSWAGLRTRSELYVEYETGELELYDLIADPGEVFNLAADGHHAERLRDLAREMAPRRGLTIPLQTPPEAKLGEPYHYRVSTWGGVAPHSLAVEGGRLPRGLTLAEDGTVTGIAEETGTFNVQFLARDSASVGVAGGPHRFRRILQLRVTR